MRLILAAFMTLLPALWPFAGHAANRKVSCEYNTMSEPELRAVLEKLTKLQYIPNGLTARQFTDQLSQAAGLLLQMRPGDALADKAFAKVRSTEQVTAALNFIYPLQFSPNILPPGEVVLKKENEFFESIDAKVFEVQRMDTSATPMAYLTLVKIRVREELRTKLMAKNPEQIIVPKRTSFASVAEVKEFRKLLPIILELMDPILLRGDSKTQVFAFISRPSDRVIGEFLTVDARLSRGMSNSFISEVLAVQGALFRGDLRDELMHALDFSWLPNKFKTP